MPVTSQDPGPVRGGKSGRGGVTLRGGRGRGAAVNGFSGAGPASLRNAAFLGGTTREEVMASGRESERYPPMEAPDSAFANQIEYDAYLGNKRLMAKLRTSQYYVRPINERKTPYETYASRKAKASEAPVPTFGDEASMRLLNPAFFPPRLWQMIFEPKRKLKKRDKARPRVNLDKAAEGAENASKEDADLFRPLSEDEADNMTDSEADGANDYEDNYFSPGEEDAAVEEEVADESVLD